MLVTGGAGTLGRPLIVALHHAGWTVRALRHRQPVEAADQVVDGDLAEAEGLAEAVPGVDAVVHLAAVTHSRDGGAYRRVNVDGTRNLLAAVGKAGVGHFVLVSSRTASESGGAYSRSKLESERLLAASGLPFTTVRLPEVFGGGGREGVDALIERVRRGVPVPLPGAGRAEVCPLFVDDAVAALIAACGLQPPANRAYTLVGECMAMSDLVARCAAVFSSSSRVVGVPMPAVRVAAALGRVLPIPVYPDQATRMLAGKHPPSTDARQHLGFEPRSLEDALAS